MAMPLHHSCKPKSCKIILMTQTIKKLEKIKIKVWLKVQSDNPKILKITSHLIYPIKL